MKTTHSLLLASTALFGIAAIQPPAMAAGLERALILAQAPLPPAAGDQKEGDKQKPKVPAAKGKPAGAPAAPIPAQPAAPKTQPQQGRPTAPAPQQKPPQIAPPPQQKPSQIAPAPQQKPSQIAPPPQQKPTQIAPPPQQKPSQIAPPPQQKPSQIAPAPQKKPAQIAPAPQQKPSQIAPAPQQKPAQIAPALQKKPAQIAPPAQPKPAQIAPATRQPTARGPQNVNPSAVPLPGKPRDANEFLHGDSRKPSQGMAAVRKERQQTREGNRLFIREGDRTIVREGNRSIIQHNESGRFAIGARDVRVEQRGDETVTIVERADGIRIISFSDRDGRLIRRIRRDRDGRELVIVDNGFAGADRSDLFIDLAPLAIGIPRERYIIDAERATPVEIYDAFSAPPVERIERRYTLDQVRYSDPLRERMPRVDLDVNFDSGSWQLTPDQIDRLSAVAQGLNRAITRNPREVFLIEGHTDAVGGDDDNLSLSDRRAEAVAVALTEGFQVPAENLVTQGYGEKYLKVPTQGPERANRRVAVRRITPLIDEAQNR